MATKRYMDSRIERMAFGLSGELGITYETVRSHISANVYAVLWKSSRDLADISRGEADSIVKSEIDMYRINFMPRRALLSVQANESRDE